MALTTDGKLLLAANNAEDPPFGTLFRANGDAGTSNVSIISKITVDPDDHRTRGLGLSIEQPAWDPKTERFYTIGPANRQQPTGLQLRLDHRRRSPATAACWLSTRTKVTGLVTVIGAFDPTTNTGVVPLHDADRTARLWDRMTTSCLGCKPGNVMGANVTTLVINAKTKNYAWKLATSPARTKSGSMQGDSPLLSWREQELHRLLKRSVPEHFAADCGARRGQR